MEKEGVNRRFDELCKTLNIKEFLDLDFDTKIKSFIQSEIDLAVANREREIVGMINGFEVYDDEADNCRRFISNTVFLITKP